MTNYKISFDIRNLMSVIALIAVTAMIWHIRDLLVVLVTAVVLATLTDGFVTMMSRFKIPRVISVVFFYLAALALFGGVIFFLIPVLITELSSLQTIYPEIGVFVQNLELIQSFSDDQIPTLIQRVSDSNTLQSIFGNLSSLLGGLLNVVILIVVSFYLSVQEKGVERFLRILTPYKTEEYAIDLWHRTKTKIGAWFRGQLFIGFLVGVLTYIGLSLLSVPYALLLALLAGLFGLIPYGIVLATLPAVAIAFVHGGFQSGLFVLVLYAVIQNVLDYVLQPIIMRKLTGLPTLIVILSLLIAGSLVGVLGLIIAVPLSVFILEIVHDREENKRKLMEEFEAIEKNNK